MSEQQEPPAYDQEADSYGSWLVAIEELKRRHERFAELQGVFKHYCPEWDFMAIDETCPEWDYCRCFERKICQDE